MELTQEDREQIENEIALYKAQSPTVSVPVSVPIAPTGQDANQDLDNIIEQEATPNKKEAKRFRKRIRDVWNRWRNTALDAKALEQEKIACQIAIERAKAQAELDKVRREEEIKELEHWLALNKGNLEEVNYNTQSKPSKFWYAIKRGFFYLTSWTDSVPKLIKNTFWGIVIVLALILLKKFNVL